MPEFIGLRGWAFAVAVADDDERGGFGLLYECYGRASGVDLGIVINGFAEKWNHPLVDFVFAVITLKVGDACAGHSGFEAIGLRDSPHGHIAAVAPAGD